MSLLVEVRDGMRVPDDREKEARALDAIIKNLGVVLGSMESLGGLSMEVGAAGGMTG